MDSIQVICDSLPNLLLARNIYAHNGGFFQGSVGWAEQRESLLRAFCSSLWEFLSPNCRENLAELCVSIAWRRD
jgi:hypothetical protein